MMEQLELSLSRLEDNLSDRWHSKHKGLSVTNSYFTVWKIQDFSITQILREINFGEIRSAKTAVFAIFGL